MGCSSIGNSDCKSENESGNSEDGDGNNGSGNCIGDTVKDKGSAGEDRVSNGSNGKTETSDLRCMDRGVYFVVGAEGRP